MTDVVYITLSFWSINDAATTCPYPLQIATIFKFTTPRLTVIQD